MLALNSGIYAVRNLFDGKVYVGASQTMRTRFKHHRRDLLAGKHHNQHLQFAFNLRGSDLEAFSFEVLEECSVGELDERERYWIELLKTRDSRFGYNIRIDPCTNRGIKRSDEFKRRVAETSTGRRHTTETRERMAQLATGRRHSAETRAKISAVQQGKPGRIPSAEAVENMRKAQRAHKKSDAEMAHIKALGASWAGRKMSTETKAKMSASQRGKKMSDTARANMSAAQKGRTVSPEHRAKIAATRVGTTASEETKRKMSESQKRSHAARKINHGIN